MKYAIVRVNGKQHKVEEGKEYTVDHLPGAEHSKLTLEDVLLVSDGKTTNVGSPRVTGSKVEATIMKQWRGEKLRVSTFKAKSRYRKTRGHRQTITTFKVEKILNA